MSYDTVKVEIWDIVDKGRSQKKSAKGLLKLFSSPASEETVDATDVPLDAEFLDVYKGAHGVVFIFDITKQWCVYSCLNSCVSIILQCHNSTTCNRVCSDTLYCPDM